MTPEINILTWIEKFKAGEFDGNSTKTQIAAGWYDWFCRDTSLSAKTRKLAPKVSQIAASPKIDPTKSYVFFKNNCPMYGSLYDDFRICDIETNAVIYTITPSTGYQAKRGRAEVYGKENGFEKPLVSGSWYDVKKFFGV